MGRGRLEAFSDGVLAIIITIMVLELKVPHGDSLHELLPLVPVFLSYVLSFVYVGIYWNNHHHMLHADLADSGPADRKRPAPQRSLASNGARKCQARGSVRLDIVDICARHTVLLHTRRKQIACVLPRFMRVCAPYERVESIGSSRKHHEIRSRMSHHHRKASQLEPSPG
jgi:hypothetical protein